MKTLTQLIENAMRAVLADVNIRATSDSYKEGWEAYLSILGPCLRRYEHHQGHKIGDEELQERYKAETALLHIITELFSRHIKYKVGVWPVNGANSPYRWYQIPSSLPIVIDEIAAKLSKLDSPSLATSEISGQILDRVCKRYLGEFYTPLSIAEHLIELSGLHPGELLEGKRTIDPACGGGIILTAIADKVISYSQEKNYSPLDVLQSLSQNLFGFDIQPFAILMTKTLLTHRCIPLLSHPSIETPPSLFPNVKLQDTLTTYNQYWVEREGLFQDLPAGFHYIIGNPPFMSAKGRLLDYLQHYKDVLYGHPNLYQLFLWWAVCAAAKGGVISFLLPQSMLGGNYFKKLREQLDLETNLISLTRMIDRTGVIGEVDLQMMAVCLEVNRDKSLRENGINIRVVRNGIDISLSKPYQVKHNRVIQKVKGSPVIWVVSEEALDYNLYEMLKNNSVILDDLNKIFTIGNGSYVWNQHKDLLREKEEADTLPLISAASIDLYGFTFPYTGSHPSHTRSFSRINGQVKHKIHSQPAILIQRTTPRKVGRRLVAGMPSAQFHQQHPQYFLENHINYIKLVDITNPEILYGLLGWLNSDLINFVFQLRNGTTLVSVYELGLLPANLELVEQLVTPTQDVVASTGQEREKKIKATNEIIFEWLGLEPKYWQRIESVLSRKEKEIAYVRR